MGTILRDLSVAWVVIHNCFMFMLLYESRFSKKVTNILTAVVMAAIVIINMRNLLLFGDERALQLAILTCALPSLVFFFIMAKNRDTRFLCTFCIVDTVVMDVFLVTNLLDTFLGFGNYIVMFISRLIILPVIEFLIVKYIRKPYHILQRYTKKGWGFFSILGALFYIAILVSVLYPCIITKRPEDIPSLILIMLLIPVMYATVFNVLWNQLSLFMANEENHVLNMQIETANERLERNKEMENNLKLMHHDMKHCLIPLIDYIDNRNFDKAREYINKLMTDIDKNTVKTYCGNNLINVVLSYYYNIVQSEKIDFNTQIRLPEKLNISETDLAVVLSNGLDNAINALKKCNNKQLFVKAFLKNNKMYLEIKNTFNGNVVFEDGMPKSVRENHGYGTKSMATIVKNNGGIYSFVTENDYFVFRCAI